MPTDYDVDEDPFKPREDPADKPEPARKRPVPIATEIVNPTGEVGLSVKFGSGYGAPMFHVKATDVYTLAALVGYDGDPGVSTARFFKGLTDYWTNVARVVEGNYKARSGGSEPAQEDKPAPRGRDTQKQSSGRGAPARGQKRTQDDDDDTDWMYDRETPPECEHGEWRPVTKVGAGTKGRWFAWGCPGGKDNSCPNGLEFVRK